MLKIKEAIIVEGRYDKNTLSQLVDTVILETSGFGIFKNTQKKKLLQRIARTRGVIIFTDSDGAGFVIRNHLKGVLPADCIKQAYVPDIYGKEHRKAKPGKEGKIGVEGMPPAVLEHALRRAGATFLDECTPIGPERRLTKADMMAAGLSGGGNSAQKRQMLLKRLDLPEHLTANALLEVLNILYTYEEGIAILGGIS